MEENDDYYLFDDDDDIDTNQNGNIDDSSNSDVENDNDFEHQDDDSDDLFNEEDDNPDLDDIEDHDGSDSPSLTSNPIIDELLKSKGIEGNIIKFENEEGEIEEQNFYDLSREEQIAILNSSDKDIDYGLDEAEINAINFLRANEISLEDAFAYYKRQGMQEYIDSQNITGVEIDNYTDEELYLLDLKDKYQDTLTEEELEIELKKQLEHPEVFKKKIDKLRAEYKEIELQQLEDAKLEQQREEEQKFAELKENLSTVANSIEDIGGLDLDIEDKEQVLEFILNKDVNGVSPFLKTLQDPKQLFQLAWYATKGQEAFDIIHNYYKKQIESVRKTTYEKAKEELTAKQTKQAKPKAAVIKQKTKPSTQSSKKYKSIDDIQID